ncbi:brassinosteroid-related acyltransferase 1-like [Pistacia vera]|uniref:brassinosteroid-related acyltransferase 1-like n=1 Tax=Pistacia vera TaxID=55513 RepID=UPI001263C808|nr:brassinosteroid-related acyltransferase 1-like [Pistacia vera]XP_031266979.1 brassinosteroid-related acyltransferase 1-like [Pistacia vera]
MDLQITLKETVTVRPCEQSNTQTIDLSGLDRMSPAILYMIFFFKSQLKKEIDHVERAKKALQKVLSQWYPAAGRFKFHGTTGKLEIDCNDEGVAMVTALTKSRLEELGCLHEYKPCYEKLVPKLPEANDISENPLVVVQMTKFACGGISIGIGGSHALFDGVGAFNFLAAWANTSKGKDDSNLVAPNHSRAALLQAIYSPNSSPKTSSIYEQEHIAAIQDLYGIPMEAMASDDRCWETALSKFGQIEPQGELALVTLSVQKEVVERLKVLATKESGKLSKCSTFDILCAHVWKARVTALKLHPDTKICLQFPVDSRSRFHPPLGKNFSGNAIVLASVSCLVRELLEEPLNYTIQRIQAAKGVITDEYIKLYAKALETSDKFLPSMRELTIVTDWLKFPLHALDFGWGRVSTAALLATPVPETAFLMPNLEESGGFLVRIGIKRQYVQNLLSKFNDFNYTSNSSSSSTYN